MINVVRIPITDRNIRCMLYIPSTWEPTLFVTPTLVTRVLKELTLQRGLMRLVSETWARSEHYPDTLAIKIDTDMISDGCDYQLKLHALGVTDKLIVCLKTTHCDGCITKEFVALYDGDHDVLAKYMKRLNVSYTTHPIEVIHPEHEHLIPITHSKSELEDLLTVAKRKLNTSLVNDLNSSDIEPNTAYDLDDASDIILKVCGVPIAIHVLGELAVSDDTCAVILSAVHREVARVHLGPTLLKEYRDYMTALTALASYNERVRCNL